MELLLSFSALYMLLSIGLIFALYWPTRKTDALASAPWLLAYLILSAMTKAIEPSIPQNVDWPGRNIFLLNWVLVISARIALLLLLVSNAAHLVGQIGFSGKVVEKLAALFRYRFSLGLMLVILTLTPTAILWAIALRSH